MLASVLKATNTKESDWTITNEDVRNRWQRAVDMQKQNPMAGMVMRMYSRVFFPDGAADYSKNLDNKVLDLPQEDFDQATKEAVEIAASGGNAY